MWIYIGIYVNLIVRVCAHRWVCSYMDIVLHILQSQIRTQTITHAHTHTHTHKHTCTNVNMFILTNKRSSIYIQTVFSLHVFYIVKIVIFIVRVLYLYLIYMHFCFLCWILFVHVLYFCSYMSLCISLKNAYHFVGINKHI